MYEKNRTLVIVERLSLIVKMSQTVVIKMTAIYVNLTTVLHSGQDPLPVVRIYFIALDDDLNAMLQICGHQLCKRVSPDGLVRIYLCSSFSQRISASRCSS